MSTGIIIYNYVNWIYMYNNVIIMRPSWYIIITIIIVHVHVHVSISNNWFKSTTNTKCESQRILRQILKWMNILKRDRKINKVHAVCKNEMFVS